jgi:hypothetical protein
MRESTAVSHPRANVANVEVLETPPRLDHIFDCYDPPLYFVTFNTHQRRKLLANDEIHERFIAFAKVRSLVALASGATF